MFYPVSLLSAGWQRLIFSQNRQRASEVVIGGWMGLALGQITPELGNRCVLCLACVGVVWMHPFPFASAAFSFSFPAYSNLLSSFSWRWITSPWIPPSPNMPGMRGSDITMKGLGDWSQHVPLTLRGFPDAQALQIVILTFINISFSTLFNISCNSTAVQHHPPPIFLVLRCFFFF